MEELLLSPFQGWPSPSHSYTFFWETTHTTGEFDKDLCEAWQYNWSSWAVFVTVITLFTAKHRMMHNNSSIQSLHDLNQTLANLKQTMLIPRPSCHNSNFRLLWIPPHSPPSPPSISLRRSVPSSIRERSKDITRLFPISRLQRNSKLWSHHELAFTSDLPTFQQSYY